MDIKVGSILNVDGLEAQVIGWIRYKNTMDGNKTWTEYRLKTNKGERWLSIDEVYKEYSISWAANHIRGNVGPEWHEVDKGHQVVVAHLGDVDVDTGEAADFVEFEDQTEEKTLSVEMWSDGTEYSQGEYLDLNEIKVVGYKKPASNMGFSVIITIAFLVLYGLGDLIGALMNRPKSISQYVKSDAKYEYVTSITGNEKQKADVYKYLDIIVTTDNVAKDIINGIEGYTESVTQKDEQEDGDIAILTKKEYCLIYHSEDDPDKVLIQVSDRKYNYSSDNTPYKSSESTSHWYRSHYYSSGFSKDSSTFSHTPSAYTNYSGDTIHNIGNGYFDSYSSSVKQSSINARNSASGGLGGGK